MICSGEATQHTRWFVFRLSICLRKTSIQRSLQRNLITSRVSLKRGRSLENLGGRGGMSAHVPTFPADDIGTRVLLLREGGRGVDDNVRAVAATTESTTHISHHIA